VNFNILHIGSEDKMEGKFHGPKFTKSKCHRRAQIFSFSFERLARRVQRWGSPSQTLAQRSAFRQDIRQFCAMHLAWWVGLTAQILGRNRQIIEAKSENSAAIEGILP